MIFSSTITFCSRVVSRLPAALAFMRRLWIVAMTAFCCARKASPSFCVQSSFSLIMVSTCGKLTRDLTLASHGCCSNALVSASPLRSLFCFTKRSACTTSSGYVEAMRICETSESGYSAIGARSWSSSSWPNAADCALRPVGTPSSSMTTNANVCRAILVITGNGFVAFIVSFPFVALRDGVISSEKRMSRRVARPIHGDRLPGCPCSGAGRRPCSPAVCRHS